MTIPCRQNVPSRQLLQVEKQNVDDDAAKAEEPSSPNATLGTAADQSNG